MAIAVSQILLYNANEIAKLWVSVKGARESNHFEPQSTYPLYRTVPHCRGTCRTVVVPHCTGMARCIFPFQQKMSAKPFSPNPHSSSTTSWCQSVTNQRSVLCRTLLFWSTRRVLVSLLSAKSTSIMLALSNVYPLTKHASICIKIQTPDFPRLLFHLNRLLPPDRPGRPMTAAARERDERGDRRRGCSRDLCKQQD